MWTYALEVIKYIMSTRFAATGNTDCYGRTSEPGGDTSACPSARRSSLLSSRCADRSFSQARADCATSTADSGMPAN